MTTKRRVVAYAMHEGEHDAAKAKLSGDATAMVEPIVTESMLIGYADQATVDELERQGVVIREVKATPPVQGKGLADKPQPVTTPLAIGAYVVIKMLEPLCEPHEAELARRGLSLVERLGNRSFVCRIDVAGADLAVAALAYVESVTIYDTAVLLRPAATAAPPGAATDSDEEEALAAPATATVGVAKPRHTFDILVHEPARRGEVDQLIATLGVQVLATATRKLRVQATEDEAEKLNGLDAVACVEEYVPPQLYNDHVRGVILGAFANTSPYTGAGEIVAVADSGVDDVHPSLAGIIQGSVARGRPGDSSDPHGHGTHVAGTIAGQGPQQGVAPGARLFFQSVMNANDGLELPLDLGQLFEEAYAAGARIHNDSWGADLEASYALTSFEVDEFVHGRKDMLIVLAAGNAGSALDPPALPKRRALPGFVEWGSIGAPATSKNALVVGASRSDRADGGHAKQTYGKVWPNRFKDPPIALQNVSGDPESIAAFSSRGPCNDRRVKPDVVAPGTDILSAKASTAPSWNFTEVVSVGDNGVAHGYMSGTSMATPAVAGFAALLREYLRTARATPQPSAALLKALIINGARRLSGVDAEADHKAMPNYHQGFGRVNLTTTLPLNQDFQLAFVDNWLSPADQLHRTGMKRRFRFTTTQPATLRVTLAYTDVPGRGVQNEISLCVEMPDGSKRWGNETMPLGVFTPDPDNNVEVFKLENAPVGDYLLIVFAKTLLVPPQDFALVVAGALAAPALTPA